MTQGTKENLRKYVLQRLEMLKAHRKTLVEQRESIEKKINLTDASLDELSHVAAFIIGEESEQES